MFFGRASRARFATLTVCLSFGPVSCGTEQQPSMQPPNVILVVIDTARADHFSSYGYHRSTTPRIDALARDGVRFETAHTTAPWTLPSHASMLTGLPPGQHGLTWSTISQSPKKSLRGDLQRRFQVRNPEGLLAERLRERGYTTIGFTNNPWVGVRTGLDSGFDHFAEVWRELPAYRKNYRQWPTAWKIGPEVDGQDAGRSLVLIKKYWDQHEVQKPYFLFFNLMEPHLPYLPSKSDRFRFGGDPATYNRMDELRGDFEKRLIAGTLSPDDESLAAFYDEELAVADRVTGHLMDWLVARGEYRDALVIVTSDHGEHLGENGLYSHQFSVESELMHVPLIVKFPGNHGAGSVEAEPSVSVLDIYQTILAASSADEPVTEKHGWARDLARVAQWKRRWTLAESYYSENFLAQFVKRNPNFDAAAQKVVRRVIYGPTHEYRFDADRLVAVLDGDQRPIEADAMAEQMLAEVRSYAEQVRGLPAPIIDHDDTSPGSTQAIEQLRALGYVE